MMLVECFISISFLLNDDGGGGIGLQLWKLKSIMFVVTVLKIENKNLHHAQSHKRLRNSSAAHLLLSFKELNLLSENQPSSKVQFTRPKQSRLSLLSFFLLIVKSKNKRTAMIVLLFSTLILFSSNHHYKRPHVLLNQGIGNSAQNYCNSNSNRGQKMYWILQYAIIDPLKNYCNNAIIAIGNIGNI